MTLSFLNSSECPQPAASRIGHGTAAYSGLFPNVINAHRTQGGIFTTPGDAYTTPVEMWVKAFGESDFPRFAEAKNAFSCLVIAGT